MEPKQTNPKQANIVRKKEDDIGLPELSRTLSNAPLSAIVPVLLKTFGDKASRISPHQVLSDYNLKSGFYEPSRLDQRLMHKFSGAFYDILSPEFKAVELSPIAPLGTNSTITKLSQDLVLTSIRGNEVQGDPTTALSLEAANRRRENILNTSKRDEVVRLATVMRALRMQPFDTKKGFTQHFGLFGLCSAGRDKKDLLFSEEAITEHISVWLDLVNKLDAEGQAVFSDVEVRITDLSILESLIGTLNLPREIINRNSLNSDWNMFKELNVGLPEDVSSISDLSTDTLTAFGIENAVKDLKRFEQLALSAIKMKYPNVKFNISLNRKAGLGYYENLCFHIFAKNKDGTQVQLSDGGTVGWVGKFLNGNKERCVTSGFGSELVQKLFSK